MATCGEVITYALRMTRVLGTGQSPSANESADGLIALQSLYDQWRTGGMFGTLEDVYLEENDEAEEGKRYYVPAGITLTAATSEYLDADGNLRQPRDLALYESLTSAGVHAAQLYDRTQWRSLLNLTSAGFAPTSGRNAWGLAACLAISGGFLAMFTDAQVTPQTVELARNFTRSLMSKQGSTQDRSEGEWF